MELTRDKQTDRLKISVVITTVYMIIIYVSSTIYLVNDDCMMKSIANGDMSGIPDGHVMFMNYAVGAFLACLYGVSRVMDWYSVFYMIAIFLSMCAFLYKSFSFIQSREGRKRIIPGLLSVVIFSLLFYPVIVKLTYTTVAAIVGIVVLMYFCMTDHPDRLDLIILSILSILCFAVRYETFLMFTPFYALILFYKLCLSEDRKAYIKTLLPAFAVILVCISALYICDRTAYNGEYSGIREINYLRSEIQDKDGLPSYEANKDVFNALGIYEEDYDMMNVCWGMTEGFTTDNLRSILDIKGTDKATVPDMIKGIYKSIRDDLSITYKLLLTALLIYYVAAGIAGKDPFMLLLLAAVILVTLGESAYILYMGRSLDYRLMYSFTLPIAGICAVYLYRYLTDGKNERIRIMVAAAGIILFGAMYVSHAYDAHSKNWIFRMEEQLMEDQDTLYLTSGIRTEERIDLFRPKRRNFIKINGWISEMPGFETAVRGDKKDIPDALATRDDLKIICDENVKDIMTAYMNRHGYPDITTENFDTDMTLMEYSVWRFR